MKKLLIALGIIGAAAGTYVAANTVAKTGGSPKALRHGVSGSLRSIFEFLLTPAWTGLPAPGNYTYIQSQMPDGGTDQTGSSSS